MAKVTGRARYTGDFAMPGMRWAAYVRSPYAHADVYSVDASLALAMPGVEAVFTADDVPQFPFPTAGHPFSLDLDHADVADRLLLTKKARYFGDEVAIVVARDQLTARQGAARVRVDYRPLPPLLEARDALAQTALVNELSPTKSNLLGEHWLETGLLGSRPNESMTEPEHRHIAKQPPENIENILAGSPIVSRGEFCTPIVQHCQLENQAAYAYMDDFQRIVVVTSTQIPHIVRRVVGQALGVDCSRIRVVKPMVGGGFGNKQDVILEPMVAWLTAQLRGRAVAICLDREECMIATRTRHPFAVTVTVGADLSGQMTALDVDALSNTGAYASHGHSIAAAGGSKLANIYPYVPYRYHARTVYTNRPTAGAMRGYGSPQICFAVESQIDDAALALGMDPLEFRLINAGHPGDNSPLSHIPMHTHGLADCLRKGAERFGWARRRAACLTLALGGGPIVEGVGLACFSYGTGTYPVNVEPAGARLLLNQDGSLNLICGATEIGQGADVAFAQMAAATLGIDYELIQVISTQDTDTSPFDAGAFASRQTFTTGHAISVCATEMRDKLLNYAIEAHGHGLNLAPVDLDLHGQAVIVRQSGQKLISLRDLALDAYYHKDRGGQIFAEANLKVRSAPPVFGCTFVEIRLDIPLCRLEIVKILNVHDAGIIINPVAATGQVHGGMAMGAGMAVLEEMLLDAEGRVLNGNLLDYKIPTAPDLPDLDCLFVESAEPLSAYGNKALGEPPLLSPAPAIRNALLHATGLAVNEIPLTPKRLFRYFNAAGLLDRFF